MPRKGLSLSPMIKDNDITIATLKDEGIDSTKIYDVKSYPFHVRVLRPGKDGKLAATKAIATHVCSFLPLAKKDRRELVAVVIGGVYAIYDNLRERIVAVSPNLSSLLRKYSWASERYDRIHDSDSERRF